MKITMLGHATLFIETQNLRILTDPILQDPHQEGMLEIFPARTLDLEKLPEFDLLFLSHRHQDHFDLESLSRLPRDVQVILPDDPLLHQAFQHLGFEHLSSVHDLLQFKVGESEFLITPSRVSFAEHGIVVRDGDGVFWNQVDTILDESAIRDVIARVGHPDLFLASWQPMMEMAWQNSEELSFPYATYAAILDNIRRVNPRTLAPGANGFRYAGPAEWMNHVVFPLPREKFLADVVDLLPDCEAVFPFDPGDVLELTGGVATCHKQAASFVRSEPRDPLVLAFCPPTAQRPLTDPLGDDGQSDYETIRTFLEDTVSAWLQSDGPLFADHRTWKVVYQLEVGFGDKSHYWHIDFRDENLLVRAGQTPIATISCGITAAALAGLINGTGSWDRASLGGSYYQFQRIYGVWEKGLVFPNRLYTPNPLSLLFPEDNVFAALIEHQLKQYPAPQ